MFKTLRQTWRGIGYLPHVGDHPGTVPLIMFLVAAAFTGSITGFILIAIPIIIMYCIGAYGRAEFSDNCQAKSDKR